MLIYDLSLVILIFLLIRIVFIVIMLNFSINYVDLCMFIINQVGLLSYDVYLLICTLLKLLLGLYCDLLCGMPYFFFFYYLMRYIKN